MDLNFDMIPKKQDSSDKDFDFQQNNMNNQQQYDDFDMNINSEMREPQSLFQENSQIYSGNSNLQQNQSASINTNINNNGNQLKNNQQNNYQEYNQDFNYNSYLQKQYNTYDDDLNINQQDQQQQNQMEDLNQYDDVFYEQEHFQGQEENNISSFNNYGQQTVKVEQQQHPMQQKNSVHDFNYKKQQNNQQNRTGQGQQSFEDKITNINSNSYMNQTGNSYIQEQQQYKKPEYSKQKLNNNNAENNKGKYIDMEHIQQQNLQDNANNDEQHSSAAFEDSYMAKQSAENCDMPSDFLEFQKPPVKKRMNNNNQNSNEIIVSNSGQQQYIDKQNNLQQQSGKQQQEDVGMLSMFDQRNAVLDASEQYQQQLQSINKNDDNVQDKHFTTYKSQSGVPSSFKKRRNTQGGTQRNNTQTQGKQKKQNEPQFFSKRIDNFLRSDYYPLRKKYEKKAKEMGIDYEQFLHWLADQTMTQLWQFEEIYQRREREMPEYINYKILLKHASLDIYRNYIINQILRSGETKHTATNQNAWIKKQALIPKINDFIKTINDVSNLNGIYADKNKANKANTKNAERLQQILLQQQTQQQQQLDNQVESSSVDHFQNKTVGSLK